MKFATQPSIRPGARHAARAGLTGHERMLAPGDLIVSKTNPKGIVTYVNDVFMKISGYDEHELLGQPHSLIRHPHMPRCVFKLMWDTLEKGQDIFAYAVNRCKNGDHYWVYAYVTPSYDEKNALVGYHSSRRKPKPSAVQTIEPLYRQLLAIENDGGRRDGLAASEQALADLLVKQKTTYDMFISSL